MPKYIEGAIIAGSWPFSHSHSGLSPSLTPNSVEVRATLLGVTRESSSGYAVENLSFYLWVDGVLTTVTFADNEGAPFTLDEVVYGINVSVGAAVADRDSGYLRLTSGTTGNGSSLKVGIHDDYSALTVLGFFDGLESSAGDFKQSRSTNDGFGSVAPGQLSAGIGESITREVFNRAVSQLSYNQDALQGHIAKKMIAAPAEATITYPAGSPGGVLLPGTVFTGAVPVPTVDQLEPYFLVQYGDGNTVRVEALYRTNAEVDRVEQSPEELMADVGIGRIELNNRIYCESADFSLTNVGDTVVISGHTGGDVPYNNNGIYRVGAVINDKTLELHTESWGPVLLNPQFGASLGAISVSTDGRFRTSPWLKFEAGDEPSEGDSVVIEYLGASTMAESTEASEGITNLSRLRSAEDLDRRVQVAVDGYLTPNLWELPDTTIVDPLEGDGLFWDVASLRWVNREAGGGLPTGAIGDTLIHNGTDWAASGITWTVPSSHWLIPLGGGTDSLKIGNTAYADGDYSTAVGNFATAPGSRASAYGHNASAVGDYSSAFGYTASAAFDKSNAIGYNARALSLWSIAVGTDCTAGSIGGEAASFGYSADAGGRYSLAMGYGPTANGQYALAMLYGANAAGQDAIAIGRSSNAPWGESIAIGYLAESLVGGIALGRGAKSKKNYSIAIGYGAVTESAAITGIAIGYSAYVTASSSGIMLGNYGRVEGRYSVALGYSAKVMGDSQYSTAFGPDALVTHDHAHVFGSSATSFKDNQFVIGGASGALSVAIYKGGTPTTNTAHGQLWVDGTTGDLNYTDTSDVTTILNAGGGASTLVDLTDTLIAGPVNGEILVYDGASSNWVNAVLPALPTGLIGDALIHNGTDWIASDWTIDSSHTLNPVGTGLNSTKIGMGAAATGERAISMGWGAQATGNYTLAFGDTATASATWAIAIGKVAAATAAGSIAVGNGTVCGGQYSTVLGNLAANTSSWYATAIGESTDAGYRATAIGSGSQANANYAVAIGSAANITDLHSIGIGTSASSNAEDAVAVGHSANVTADHGIAIGLDSLTSGVSGLAIGLNSVCSGSSSTALGSGAISSEQLSVSVGYLANTAAWNTVAIGASTDATIMGAIAIGYSGQATASYATAIGGYSVSHYANSIALGKYATTSQVNQFMVGSTNEPLTAALIAGAAAPTTNANYGSLWVDASGDLNYKDTSDVTTILNSASGASTLSDLTDTTIGALAEGEILTWDNTNSVWINNGWTIPATQTLIPSGSAADSLRIGKDSIASAIDAMAIGRGASSTIHDAIAIGTTASASGLGDPIAIGRLSVASGSYAVSLGLQASSIDVGSVAVGFYAHSEEEYAIAIGAAAYATGLRSVVVGGYASASLLALYGISIGYSATALADSSMAIGQYAYSSHASSIALGADAQTFADNQCAIGDPNRPLSLALAIGGSSVTDIEHGQLFVDAGGDLNYTDTSDVTTILNAGGGASTLADLTDTLIAGPVNGEILVYDGASSNWVNAVPSGGGASTVADLTDTTIGVLAEGEILTWDNTNSVWINNGWTIPATQVLNPLSVGDDSIKIGNTGDILGTRSIGIGFSANTLEDFSTSIGSHSHAGGIGSLAIGHSANVYENYDYAISVGYGPSTSGLGAIAIGKWAQARSGAAIAIGFEANRGDAYAGGYGIDAVAIGKHASTPYIDTIAIGRGASAWSGESIAIGAGAETKGYYAVVIGNGIAYASSESVAIGYAARTFATAGTAIGYSADAGAAGKYYATAIGNRATASNTSGISIGYTAINGGYQSIAIGANSYVYSTAHYSVAIGYQSVVEQTHNTALGFSTRIYEVGGIAVGYNADVGGTHSTAIGFSSVTGADYALAIGDYATSAFTNAVAFGKDSVTFEADQLVLGSAAYPMSFVMALRATPTSHLSYGQLWVDVSGDLYYMDNDGITTMLAGEGSGGIMAIEDATDTNIVTPAEGEILTWDNTNLVWINNGWTVPNTHEFSPLGGGANSVKIGVGALAAGNYSVSVGNESDANWKGVAIGYRALANSGGGIGIGYMAKSGGSWSIAFGEEATSYSAAAIAIGYDSGNTSTTEVNTISIGYKANATILSGIAIGDSAFSYGESSIAMGTDSIVASGANYAVAIGNIAKANFTSSIAIGDNAFAEYGQAVVLGYSSSSFGLSTLIGSNNRIGIHGHYSVVIGAYNKLDYLNNLTDQELWGAVVIGRANEVDSAVADRVVETPIIIGAYNIIKPQTAATAGRNIIIGWGTEMQLNDYYNTVSIGAASHPFSHNQFVMGSASSKYSLALAKGIAAVATNANYGQLWVNADGDLSYTDTSDVTTVLNSAGGASLPVGLIGDALIHNGTDWIASDWAIDSAHTLNPVGTGLGSVKVGVGSSAFDYSTAVGAYATAPGSYCAAFGYGADAIGARAISIGYDSYASADYTISLGSSSDATFTGAISVGYASQAINLYAIAMGYSADATGPNAVAIGLNAQSTGDQSVSVGPNSRALGWKSVAVGNAADATQPDCIAIGNNCNANDDYAITLGRDSDAIRLGCISVGKGTKTDAPYCLALGYGAKAGTGNITPNATAIGYFAQALHSYATAIGSFANTYAASQVVIGSSTKPVSFAIYKGGSPNTSTNHGQLWVDAGGDLNYTDTSDVTTILNSAGGGASTLVDLTDTVIATPADGEVLTYDTATSKWINAASGGVASTVAGLTDTTIGVLAEGEILTWDNTNSVWINNGWTVPSTHEFIPLGAGVDSIKIGSLAGSDYLDAIAIGHNAIAVGVDSVVIGHNAATTFQQAIAVGREAIAKGERGIAIGYYSSTNYGYTTAVGGYAEAGVVDQSASAFGYRARAVEKYSVSLGYRTEATGYISLAVGYDCEANGESSVAIGDISVAQAYGSMAIGRLAEAISLYSLTLGVEARSAHLASIALGWKAGTFADNQLVMGSVEAPLSLALYKGGTPTTNTNHGQLWVDATGDLNYTDTSDVTTILNAASGGSGLETDGTYTYLEFDTSDSYRYHLASNYFEWNFGGGARAQLHSTIFYVSPTGDYTEHLDSYFGSVTTPGVFKARNTVDQATATFEYRGTTAARGGEIVLLHSRGEWVDTALGDVLGQITFAGQSEYEGVAYLQQGAWIRAVAIEGFGAYNYSGTNLEFWTAPGPFAGRDTPLLRWTITDDGHLQPQSGVTLGTSGYRVGVSYLNKIYLSETSGQGIASALNPAADNTHNLGSTTNAWNFAYIKYVGETSRPSYQVVTDRVMVGMYARPIVDGGADLGQASYYWGTTYTENLILGTEAGEGVSSSLIPSAAGASEQWHLGSTTNPWNQIHGYYVGTTGREINYVHAASAYIRAIGSGTAGDNIVPVERIYVDTLGTGSNPVTYIYATNIGTSTSKIGSIHATNIGSSSERIENAYIENLGGISMGVTTAWIFNLKAHNSGDDSDMQSGIPVVSRATEFGHGAAGFFERYSDDAVGGEVILAKRRGSTTTAGVSIGDVLGQITFMGASDVASGAGVYNEGAIIRAVALEDFPSSSHHHSNLEFWVGAHLTAPVKYWTMLGEDGSLVPAGAATQDIGSATNRVSTLYVDTIDVASVEHIDPKLSVGASTTSLSAAVGDSKVIDTSAGDVTVTFPIIDASDIGRVIEVSKVSAAGTVTIAVGQAGDLINGAASDTISSGAYSVTMYRAISATDWLIVNKITT